MRAVADRVRWLAGRVWLGGRVRAAGLLLGLVLVCGCAAWTSREPRVENHVVEYYRRVAERIEYSDAGAEPVSLPPSLGETRPLVEPTPEERWPISLAEAIRLGLQNNDIIRQNGQFLSPGNPILVNPDGVPSIFDVEIQNHGVLFGSRGVHAALSDFDPRLVTSMKWGREENAQNNGLLSGGIPPGGTLAEENAAFQSRLEQPLLSGGTFAISQNWNYSLNNQSSVARLFQSAYIGSLGAEYRQPLWSGAGREFNAIAGPASQRARGFSYVNQGIVIAQINRRISEIDFEETLQNLVREIGDLYWDLHLAWQEYLAEQSTAEASQKLWDEVQAKFRADLVGGAEEAQAEDASHEAVARRDLALSTFFQTEARMRRLLGLPIDDGRLLVTSDPPRDTAVDHNRATCLFEAYVNRLELRRQKTNIQSLELQLAAAKNLAHPRLDFVAGYRLNGFGDKLIANSTADGKTTEGFNSAYAALFRGHQTSWDLGFEYSIPLWMRSERAQVRQLELRLLKARTALAAQENEIARELNAVFQTLQRWQHSAQTYDRRRLAAGRRVEAASSEYRDAGRTGVDPLVRAEISQTQAEIAYHRSLAEYNKALRDLLYRTGRLLQEDGIQLRTPDGLPTTLPTPTLPFDLPPPGPDLPPPAPEVLLPAPAALLPIPDLPPAPALLPPTRAAIDLPAPDLAPVDLPAPEPFPPASKPFPPASAPVKPSAPVDLPAPTDLPPKPAPRFPDDLP